MDKKYSCIGCGRKISHRGKCLSCNSKAKKERLEITFKEFKDVAKYITVECPHCEDMFLLSEAKFQLKADKVKSWLAKYNKRLQKLLEKEYMFEEKEENFLMKQEQLINKVALKEEEMRTKIAEIKTEYLEKKKELSRKAIATSKGVKLGYFLENWIPHFKLLFKKYNPCDYVYLGKPIDFIVFDGMEANDIKNLTFLEVKSGSSGFSKRERQICECVKKGKVKFETIRVKDNKIELIKEKCEARKTKYHKETYNLKK